jgi:hypothetical protein
MRLLTEKALGSQDKAIWLTQLGRWKDDLVRYATQCVESFLDLSLFGLGWVPSGSHDEELDHEKHSI